MLIPNRIFTIEELKEMKLERDAINSFFEALKERYVKEKMWNLLHGTNYLFDWYDSQIAQTSDAQIKFEAKWGIKF